MVVELLVELVAWGSGVLDTLGWWIRSPGSRWWSSVGCFGRPTPARETAEVEDPEQVAQAGPQDSESAEAAKGCSITLDNLQGAIAQRLLRRSTAIYQHGNRRNDTKGSSCRPCDSSNSRSLRAVSERHR